MVGREIQAEIIAGFGRQFLVETDAGQIIRCVARGKRTEFACGDRTVIAMTGPDEGVIEDLLPRANLFFRAAQHRSKLLGANLSQVALIVAVEPSFSDELLCRAIVRAEVEGLRVLIVLNKIDLPDARQARSRLQPFAHAGYEIVETSAIGELGGLRARLAGERSVLVGQSGMGKSSIVNALFPGANAETNEVSVFLASGRHTTTSSRLYRLPEGGVVIDCPGMQEFGLADLSREAVESGFVELQPYRGHCRFADCRHLAEPGCAVKAAAASGAIAARRLEMLHRITPAVATS